MNKLEERKAVAKAGVIKGNRTAGLSKTKRTTHLSAKSTSKMSRNVNKLNKKVLQQINA